MSVHYDTIIVSTQMKNPTDEHTLVLLLYQCAGVLSCATLLVQQVLVELEAPYFLVYSRPLFSTCPRGKW
jgi:hypothetical protein